MKLGEIGESDRSLLRVFFENCWEFVYMLCLACYPAGGIHRATLSLLHQKAATTAEILKTIVFIHTIECNRREWFRSLGSTRFNSLKSIFTSTDTLYQYFFTVWSRIEESKGFIWNLNLDGKKHQWSQWASHFHCSCLTCSTEWMARGGGAQKFCTEINHPNSFFF